MGAQHPRGEVIAHFTKIIEGRQRPNETTKSLKFWLSVGVPSTYGEIKDSDFSRWQNWLVASGAVKQPVNPTDLYTNEFNPNIGGAAATEAAS